MLQICSSKSCYIDKFVIYGERHSGTNLLEQCFKSRFGLEKTDYFGNKHFFGWTKPELITYHKSSLHTLFIGVVRNPYDWIMSMINRPHHINHHRLLDLPKFLTSEWYSTHNDGSEILTDRDYRTKCRYKNIFNMRTIKYEYLSQTMPILAHNYILLSYDTWLKNYHNYLNIISNRFNLRITGSVPSLLDKQPYLIPSNIKTIIDNQCDWNLESSLGFDKRID